MSVRTTPSAGSEREAPFVEPPWSHEAPFVEPPWSHEAPFVEPPWSIASGFGRIVADFENGPALQSIW